MTFPLWYILVPYSAVVFFAAIFLFFNVFHLYRYGIEAGKTYGLVATYTISFLVILGLSAGLLLTYDWNYEVAPEALLPFSDEATRNYGL